MARAWIENGNIFVTEDNTLIIPFPTIEVPSGTTPQNLKIENGELKFKTAEEKETEARQQRIVMAEQQRRQAYQQETDAIFFKAQEELLKGNTARYETLMQEWLTRKNEIRAKYTYD